MYILQVGQKSFIKITDKTELVTDYNDATTFPKIGDAMRAAVSVNNDIGNHLVKVTYLNSPVSE